MTRTCEIPLLHHAAEVCNAAFHRLDTAIASGIEHQLRGARQLSGLRGRQAKIHLEGDPSLWVLRTRVAAEIVLACGEKDGWSFIGGAVVERSLPDVACRAAERLHTAAALYADSRGDGLGDERCIERLARERGCGKRQGSLRGAPGSGEANVVDGHGAKRGHVDAERMQVLKGLTAQELSADLMARCGLAFDQRDASSLAGERDRSGTACHSTTEDENFVLQRNPIQIGRSNGNLLFRIGTLECTVYGYCISMRLIVGDHRQTSGELAPVEAEVHDKQRGQSEGDDADGGEGVAEVAPVTGPELSTRLETKVKVTA